MKSKLFSKSTLRRIKRTIAIVLLIAISSGLLTGILYQKYCTNKITAREQHLMNISKMVLPPQGSVKVKESMLEKFIFRSYYLYYTYERTEEEAIRHYINELMNMGYKVKQIKSNKLKGQKGDILIEVEYDTPSNDLFVRIYFDDIYEKLRI